jgi:hypothetical protein
VRLQLAAWATKEVTAGVTKQAAEQAIEQVIAGRQSAA